MRFKFLFLILILSVSVFSVVTYNDCYKVALKYVKYSEGESLDMKPNALTDYNSKQYWVFEVKSVGNIQFMIPVDANSGNLFYESSVKDVMKAHYLANFFATDDSFNSFLDNLLSFTQRQRSDLETKKTNLETYIDPYLNVSISSESAYKNALDSSINNADSLRAAITSLQGELTSLGSFSDVAKVQNGFRNVFSKEKNFLDSLNNVVSKSNDLHTEVGELSTNGDIDPSTRDSLLTYTTHSGLTDAVISKQDALTGNKKVIDDFFNGMDTKIGQFYVNLIDRIDTTTDSSVIDEAIASLNNYSSTYTLLGKQIDDRGIPASYKGINDKMIELHSLISQGNDACKDKVLEDCQNVLSNFSSIDSLINEINSTVNSYEISSCSDGQKMACVIGTNHGFKTCNNGVWGSCEVSSGSGYNFKLIALLVLVIVGLIGFKYKDELIEKFGGGGESEEDDSGSWQNQWNQ